MKRKQTPEGALLRLTLDLLAAEHIFALRMQTGATVSTYKGKTRMVRYGVPGMGDVLAFPHNPVVLWKGVAPYETIVDRFLPTWLEIKAPDGKHSDLQKSFQAQVEAEGHKYCVCRSIEDVRAALGIQ